MADDDAIQRKRERLAAETYEYFWNICPELTARWKRAMLTLPSSVFRDLAVEIKGEYVLSAIALLLVQSCELTASQVRLRSLLKKASASCSPQNH
jgi:hypothetical protein